MITPRLLTAFWSRATSFGALTLISVMVLNACSSTATKPTPLPMPPPIPPLDVTSIPDAVPQLESLSPRGNPAFYDVLGQRYFVMANAAGYVERGVASWYGPGFHREATSNGERYDMYGMTAAHKTLPLPAYVQVTNLSNGKTIVVRVNDRGPFKSGRIIDLSYSAAVKLDMLRAGTALVEVKALTPGQAASPDLHASLKGLYVQAGAFSNADNAERLVKQLQSRGYTQAYVRSDLLNGRSLFRVRIGPIVNVDAFDAVVTQIKNLGISDAHLALD